MGGIAPFQASFRVRSLLLYRGSSLKEGELASDLFHILSKFKHRIVIRSNVAVPDRHILSLISFLFHRYHL